MTTRYKTEGEKEGVQRRMADYRKRLREAGLKPREVWTSDSEIVRMKSILSCWRGEETDFDPAQQIAADALKPEPK